MVNPPATRDALHEPSHTLSCIHTRHIGDDASPCRHVLKVYIHHRLSVASDIASLWARRSLGFLSFLLFVPNMLISFACFLFICHVTPSLFCRCPRLNCSCICYGFDLRGYVPGAVLRLTDSMKLLYAWDRIW